MQSNWFNYNKPKVIQALRYHFISRREIKVLMILVNVFAVVTAAAFFFKKISPLAFLLSSAMWFILMLLFWFILPTVIYNKARTFRDTFRVRLNETGFVLENEKGERQWNWKEFSTWLESPHFFHLYFSSRAFFIVPKEAFTGDDEHEARKMFREKIRVISP